MQKIDHLSKYATLFTYSELSPLDQDGFGDTWRIHITLIPHWLQCHKLLLLLLMITIFSMSVYSIGRRTTTSRPDRRFLEETQLMLRVVCDCCFYAIVHSVTPELSHFADLIELFKTVHGLSVLDSETFF